MKFLIREKRSHKYFAEPGGGLVDRSLAFMYDTDEFKLNKQDDCINITHKEDEFISTWFEVCDHVVIPVGDL